MHPNGVSAARVIFLLLVASVICSTSEAATWDAVTLTWTAPGDDGNVGRATQYDVRYSTSNISGTDTTAWWSQATQCAGEPTPQLAGATEIFTVAGLQSSTTYYFMIRSADEVPNWSGFSNVAAKVTTAAPDTIPPASVRDLASMERDVMRGDFSLVLAAIYAIVAPGSQERFSLDREEYARHAGWPVLFSEPCLDPENGNHCPERLFS